MTRSIRRTKRRLLPTLGLLLAFGVPVSLTLSACTAEDPLAAQAAAGDGKN